MMPASDIGLVITMSYSGLFNNLYVAKASDEFVRGITVYNKTLLMLRHYINYLANESRILRNEKYAILIRPRTLPTNTKLFHLNSFI